MSVTTTIGAKKFGPSALLSRLVEKGHERPQPLLSEVAQQPGEHPADRLVQRVEKVEPRLRDARPHDAAVLGVAEPRDEAALLQPVEEAGDVRPRADQPLADLAAGQGVRPGA